MHELAVIGPDAIPPLIETLENTSNPSLRRSAAYTLALFGPEAKAAIPALVHAARDDDLAEPAGVALLAMGKLAVPALVESLQDGEGKTRAWAANLMGRMAIHARAAVPALLKALQDEDPGIRFEAADALGEIDILDDRVRAALQALEKDPDRQVRALARLWMVFSDATARETPEPLLSRGDLMSKESLIDQGFDLDPEGNVVVGKREPWYTGMRDPGPPVEMPMNVNIRALKCRMRPGQVKGLSDREFFGGLRKNPRLWVPVLFLGMTAADPGIRAEAVRGLGHQAGQGTVAKEVMPALIEALGDPDPGVRKEAALMLGGLGPNGKVAMPELRKLTRDKMDTVRSQALVSLWRIGKDPDAIAALGNEGSLAALQHLQALGRDAKGAAPALIQVLRAAQSYSLRKEAAKALGAMGPDGSDAVDALIEVATANNEPWEPEKEPTESQKLAIDAVEALGNIGPNKKTVPVLLKLWRPRKLKDGKRSYSQLLMNRSALMALTLMGRAAEEAAPDLIAIMKEPVWSGFAGQAALALVAVAPPEQALAPVMNLLKTFDKFPPGDGPYELKGLVEALGMLGPVAIEAAPILRKRLVPGPRRVGGIEDQISEALKRIEGK